MVQQKVLGALELLDEAASGGVHEVNLTPERVCANHAIDPVFVVLVRARDFARQNGGSANVRVELERVLQNLHSLLEGFLSRQLRPLVQSKTAEETKEGDVIEFSFGGRDVFDAVDELLDQLNLFIARGKIVVADLLARELGLGCFTASVSPALGHLPLKRSFGRGRHHLLLFRTTSVRHFHTNLQNETTQCTMEGLWSRS
mmetsp:Transcript_24527/g.35929  ORF Transcript_24527/g.35929 Transcript_24527/m.35929 type:complete len:201 (+) Transcript_24527:768-1370(+)